jgi:hypothetical protein
VLNGSRGWDRDNGRWYDVANWHTDSADSRQWIKLSDYASVSSVIELKPGEEKEIDVMIAEVPGGNFNAILCVMEEGVTYENNVYSEPILPLFKTAELSREYMDLIYRGMPANEITLTNGPIFNDYQSNRAPRMWRPRIRQRKKPKHHQLRRKNHPQCAYGIRKETAPHLKANLSP